MVDEAGDAPAGGVKDHGLVEVHQVVALDIVFSEGFEKERHLTDLSILITSMHA